MEDTMKLEMKIISKETIKPSTRTPLHLKTLRLSLFDQLFPAFHIPLLLLYNNNAPKSDTPVEQIITNLKSSLSQTLSQFYPLAGRCIDEDFLSCNDQGVPFIETQVDSRLTEFLASSHKLNVLGQLLPPREILTSGSPPLISEMVPLAFQINVFACGGIVIGSFIFHKLLDMSSCAALFHNWAATAAQRYHDVVEPSFKVIVEAFPPLSVKPVLDWSRESGPTPTPSMVVLVKSFRFTKKAIKELKVIAATEVHPNPTTFETVAGFIWESVVAAGCIARAAANETTTNVSMSFNIRTRTNPPLPRTSIGNCITSFPANATIQGATFPELVGEFHSTILKAKLRIQEYQLVNGVEEMLKDVTATRDIFGQANNSSVYALTSWCNLGLSDADFGFGKPNWIVPTDHGIFPMMLRNHIVLTDYNDDINGQGIEVWLYLEEKEMQVLQTNPRFLQFASPY